MSTNPNSRTVNLPPINSYVFKVASRCNLNCTYCYVYNQGDDSWRSRPAKMSNATFEIAIERIREYALAEGRSRLSFSFHGGEPCLIGATTFDNWCRLARKRLSFLDLSLGIQTNGTLVDDAWCKVFKENRVAVGISIDGPAEINDRARIDHAGRGSYQDIVRGLRALQEHSIEFTFLCVVPIGAEPLAVHQHLRSLNPKRIDYLLPDSKQHTPNWGTVGEIATPCADFLIPVFEDWWQHDQISLRIPIFIQIAKLIMGGDSDLDILGGGPLSFLFIEADGDIESLDVLKTCENGLPNTHLSVYSHGFDALTTAPSFFRDVLVGSLPTPGACANCPERPTCAGGYLPHRYRAGTSFDNVSIWCADIIKLFSHIRGRLGVTVQETALRRRVLEEMREVEQRER